MTAPVSPSPPLHVHGGDCAAAVARRAALPGEVLAWRDSAAVGPAAVDPERHRQLRATWWGVEPAEMQSARDLPADRELVLWFGPDPWEQISLVEVMAGARARSVSVVVVDRAVSLADPDSLAAPFASRRPAADLAPGMAQVWRDFCLDDRAALRAWTTRLVGEERLPHLPAALERVLDDRDGARTERQVRWLVEAGVTDLSELMQRLGPLEAPNHGVWYGDVVVRRLRDRITGPV